MRERERERGSQMTKPAAAAAEEEESCWALCQFSKE